jgi:hypothetical protein
MHQNIAVRVDADDAQIAKLSERMALQDALMRIMSDRLSKLEGAEPEPDRSGSTTIQRAAHETGYSQSGIRKRIASGKITATQFGRRWIIDRASLTPKVR